MKIVSKILVACAVAGMLTGCVEDTIAYHDNFKAEIVKGHPTGAYGGGTEMTVISDSGELIVFAVDFRNQAPITFETDSWAGKDTLTCDTFAYDTRSNILSYSETGGCKIATSDPSKYF